MSIVHILSNPPKSIWEASPITYGVQMMRSEFNKFIKTTKAQCAYQELEFIAEFGGYVGLFLGISVFHVREAFQRLIHTFLPN